MADLIFSERPELKDQLAIAYCPERVLPGNVIYELVHNDRVIGGVDETSTDRAIAFYNQFVKGELHRTNSRTAEMCKMLLTMSCSSSSTRQASSFGSLSLLPTNILASISCYLVAEL